MFTTANLNPAYNYNMRHDSGDNPKKTGHPDRDLLDRTEAYEMVDFINHILSTWKWSIPLTQGTIVSTGQKIEKIVRTVISTDVRQRDRIEALVRQHWNN